MGYSRGVRSLEYLKTSNLDFHSLPSSPLWMSNHQSQRPQSEGNFTTLGYRTSRQPSPTGSSFRFETCNSGKTENDANANESDESPMPKSDPKVKRRIAAKSKSEAALRSVAVAEFKRASNRVIGLGFHNSPDLGGLGSEPEHEQSAAMSRGDCAVIAGSAIGKSSGEDDELPVPSTSYVGGGVAPLQPILEADLSSLHLHRFGSKTSMESVRDALPSLSARRSFAFESPRRARETSDRQSFFSSHARSSSAGGFRPKELLLPATLSSTAPSLSPRRFSLQDRLATGKAGGSPTADFTFGHLDSLKPPHPIRSSLESSESITTTHRHNPPLQNKKQQHIPSSPSECDQSSSSVISYHSDYARDIHSGSTFELVPWQVATDAGARTDDLFVSYSNDFPSAVQGPLEPDAASPSTPLKRQSSSKIARFVGSRSRLNVLSTNEIVSTDDVGTSSLSSIGGGNGEEGNIGSDPVGLGIMVSNQFGINQMFPSSSSSPPQPRASSSLAVAEAEAGSPTVSASLEEHRQGVNSFSLSCGLMEAETRATTATMRTTAIYQTTRSMGALSTQSIDIEQELSLSHLPKGTSSRKSTRASVLHFGKLAFVSRWKHSKPNDDFELVSLDHLAPPRTETTAAATVNEVLRGKEKKRGEDELSNQDHATPTTVVSPETVSAIRKEGGDREIQNEARRRWEWMDRACIKIRVADTKGYWIGLSVLAGLWQILFMTFPAAYLFHTISPAVPVIAAIMFIAWDVGLGVVLFRWKNKQSPHPPPPPPSSCANTETQIDLENLPPTVDDDDDNCRRELPLQLLAILWSTVCIIYTMIFCALQLTHMVHSQDLGIHSAGIHLSTSVTTTIQDKPLLLKVVKDVPFSAILFLLGSMGLPLLTVWAWFLFRCFL